MSESKPPSSSATPGDSGAGRLPAFDPAVVKKIPNDVSRVAFFDRWINRRIDEAAAAGSQLDGRLASFSQAQAGMNKVLDAVRAGVAAAQPVLEQLQAARIDAEAVARDAAKAAQTNIEQAVKKAVAQAGAESRHALEGALEPVELDCARRLEAMLAQAHSQMESAARCSIANTRQQIGQMHEQMLAAAQEISRSIQATLSAAEQAARQLATAVEQTLRAEEGVRATPRFEPAEIAEPTSATSGRITETAESAIDQICRATEDLHEQLETEIADTQHILQRRIADASEELAGYRERMMPRTAAAALPVDGADEVIAAADEALRVLNWVGGDPA